MKLAKLSMPMPGGKKAPKKPMSSGSEMEVSDDELDMELGEGMEVGEEGEEMALPEMEAVPGELDNVEDDVLLAEIQKRGLMSQLKGAEMGAAETDELDEEEYA